MSNCKCGMGQHCYRCKPAPSPQPEMPHPLFRHMERLSDELCQTQAFILRALDRAGLTIVGPADRAVLGAMAEIPLGVLEAIRDQHSCVSPIFHPPCLAELARRAAKEGT